jgi:hypothetical protein
MQNECSSPCLQKLTNELYPGPLNPVQRSLNPILSNTHFNNILPSIPRFFSLLQHTYKSPYKIADYVQIMFSNCTWILITERICLIKKNKGELQWVQLAVWRVCLLNLTASVTCQHSSIYMSWCSAIVHESLRIQYDTENSILKISLPHSSKKSQMPLCNISMLCAIKHPTDNQLSMFSYILQIQISW